MLFVAISINLDQILKYPRLPGRAGTLGILSSALSGFALAPGLETRALGIEIAAAGAVVAAQTLWVVRDKDAPDEVETWAIEHLATLLLPTVAFMVGGVSLVAGLPSRLGDNSVGHQTLRSRIARTSWSCRSASSVAGCQRPAGCNIAT